MDQIGNRIGIAAFENPQKSRASLATIRFSSASPVGMGCGADTAAGA
jgi:hypothetical protein